MQYADILEDLKTFLETEERVLMNTMGYDNKDGDWQRVRRVDSYTTSMCGGESVLLKRILKKIDELEEKYE